MITEEVKQYFKFKQYFIESYVKIIKQEGIPEWVNWIAADSDGTIWVYQEKPVLGGCNFFNDSFYGRARQLETLFTDKNALNYCQYSILKIEELLPHYPSQEEETVQDKVEFEAISGDQSLFDLVGADNDDLFVIKLENIKSIVAMSRKSSSFNIIAERKVKEKPYIPEVGHTYKLSTEQGVTFTCVFVDIDGDVWSTCNGTMFTHYIDYLSRESVKFIRIS